MSLRDDFRNRRMYFLAAAVALLVDQASKIAAVAWLQGKGQVPVIPGFLNLWFSTNRGGLFGYFGNLGEPWREILLIGMPLLFVAGMVLFLARTDEPDRATLFGLAMMLGGATGNLIDRVLRGEVVDFFDVYASHPRMASFFLERFGTVHWPTFNVADSAIAGGVAEARCRRGDLHQPADGRGCAAAITVGTLYQKRFVAPCDVRTANTVQLLAALAVTAPLARLEDGHFDLHPELIGAMAWSVLVLTLGGSSLLLLLIQRGAATRVTSLMYMVPPCTALLAWLLFREALTPVVFAGIALTAIGVPLVVRGPARG